MDTTCGSFAFLGTRPKENAPVVQMVRALHSDKKDRKLIVLPQLLDAGLLIIGKTNLTVSSKPYAIKL